MHIQEVTFSVEGQTLRGKLFYPEKVKEKNPAVLLIHGWESTQERMVSVAEPLAKIGYFCLTFDFRGHGKSDGDFQSVSRKDHLEDAKTAYDFLKSQANAETISIVGSSYGSYISVLLTQEISIKNMILRVPAMYPEEGFDLPVAKVIEQRENMLILRKQKFSLHDNKVLKAMHKFSGNILLVESENDEELPHQNIQNFIDAVNDKAKLTHMVMKDTAHSLGTDEKRQEFAKIVIDWFTKLDK